MRWEGGRGDGGSLHGKERWTRVGINHSDITSSVPAPLKTERESTNPGKPSRLMGWDTKGWSAGRGRKRRCGLRLLPAALGWEEPEAEKNGQGGGITANPRTPEVPYTNLPAHPSAFATTPPGSTGS